MVGMEQDTWILEAKEKSSHAGTTAEDRIVVGVVAVLKLARLARSASWLVVATPKNCVRPSKLLLSLSSCTLWTNRELKIEESTLDF